MNQADCDKLLSTVKILPVVKIPSLEDALPIAEALKAGGIPLIEVTLRSDCALDAIKKIADPDSIAIGSGTVMNLEQAKASHEAGASFVVCPGLDEEVIQYCKEKDLAVYPGVSTGTEVQRAYNLGLRCVKLFPAEACGGANLLKALSGPFPEMKFVPTGGVSLKNINSYLSIGSTLAAGGSWMTKEAVYKNGNYQEISKLAQEATATFS